MGGNPVAMSGARNAKYEIPSLNGIRAVSVLIVFASHAGFERFVPGGLGVAVFFFLSGFLITTLLLREFSRNGEIDFVGFYKRRFLRLMPPLLVTLAVAYGLTLLYILPGHVTLAGLASQLFYFANYEEIYFGAAQKTPEGTGVLWSLAVEEHFYMIFPVLLLAALAAHLRNRSLIVVALAVCAGILLWRIYLVCWVGVSETRTYYASDTRLDSIVYGCVLAFAMNGRTDDAANASRLSFRDWALLATAGLVLLSTLVIRDQRFRETLRYSLQGIALLPIFYLAVMRHRHWLFRVLNSKLAVRIGIYSYSIYLIHRVIIIALEVQVEQLAGHPLMLAGGSLALSIAFAVMIDRLVDSRFRNHRTEARRPVELGAETVTGG